MEFSNYTPSRPLYNVDLNFDESEIAWRSNKQPLKQGMFTYKKEKTNCYYCYTNNKRCRKKKVINEDFCELHFTSKL